jgi:hypothetical protein
MTHAAPLHGPFCNVVFICGRSVIMRFLSVTVSTNALPLRTEWEGESYWVKCRLEEPSDFHDSRPGNWHPNGRS